jgi:hypothetical protein
MARPSRADRGQEAARFVPKLPSPANPSALFPGAKTSEVPGHPQGANRRRDTYRKKEGSSAEPSHRVADCRKLLHSGTASPYRMLSLKKRGAQARP